MELNLLLIFITGKPQVVFAKQVPTQVPTRAGMISNTQPFYFIRPWPHA